MYDVQHAVLLGLLPNMVSGSAVLNYLPESN